MNIQFKEMRRTMKYAIGIDTGGTCTDAVLYDFDTGKVLCSNKALTTYDDLTRGILEALDGLDASLCRQACAAGLFTTLATNACVENKGGRVFMIFIGVSEKVVRNTYRDYGFESLDDILFVEGNAKLISLFVIVLHKFLQSPHLHQPQYEARISRLRFRLFIRFTFRAKFFFIFLRIRTLSFVKQ